MLSWMRDKLYVGRQKIGKVLNRRGSNDCGISPENSCSFSKKMLVEDTNLFPNEHIKLHIIGTDGSVWTINTPPDISIANLKSMALTHFFNPVESTKLQNNFKLVAVSTKRVLHPDNSVQDECLTIDEEILLVERRLTEPKDTVIYDDSQKGPSQKEILAATEHLTPKNIVKMPAPLDCSEDFQSEFRKILISLVEVAAQLLTVRPDADEVFASITDRLETRDKIVPDKNAVRNLMEMGFSEEKVILALRLKRNNPNEALEWLLERGASKVDVCPSIEMLANENDRGAEAAEKPTVVQSVAKLLASFRSFRRKEFRPSPKALQAMLEMGFVEKEAVEALRITGNNQASACEWLLGDRGENLQDLDTGLDSEGPIYKALLANPAIQLGLNNPRLLLGLQRFDKKITCLVQK
ncbi:kip1 ubiquitination-promoting complex subunit 2 isoform X2 [Lycorma delicatula]|uniref:kip1 ubiquitination-promoting complex subunit 2 isoform X2 n=1 Tax=Lycorma delicatula TaxID=130591 RepID=UPI003F5167D1